MFWHFPTNNDGEINGIGHSGIETFQGAPLKSLAREICQNSIDATIDNETTIIEFKSFKINSNNFPDKHNLLKAFENSIKFWEVQNVQKSRQFFEKAIKTLSQNEILFLRISDYNTTGLLGSKEEYNSPWCNLTKSSGISDKSATAGGSYGIGKFAPFACSELRTVFYETIDTTNTKCTQGISRITSFRNEEKKITVGTGYYGDKNNRPIYDLVQIDPNHTRKTNQTGTDIYIAGFQFNDTEWTRDIINSILDGFLYAIYNEKLIVKIEDLRIDKESLPMLMEDYKNSNDVTNENADKYYEVLISKEDWHEIDFMNKGLIKLKLKIDTNYHRKVAMIRKSGMKIFDKNNISGVIPFAGVLIIEGEDLNDILRKIENPQHTKWEPKRLTNKEWYARDILKNLTSFIKDTLRDIANEDTLNSIDPDVGEFLPDLQEQNQELTNPTQSESLDKSIKKIQISQHKKNQIILESNQENTLPQKDKYILNRNNADPKVPVDFSKIPKKNDYPENSKKPSGDSLLNNFSYSNKKVPIIPTTVKFICLRKDKGEYSLFFEPKESANSGEIKLYLCAETQNFEAEILNVKSFTHPEISFRDNIITGISFEKGKLLRFLITLAYYDYCAIEVKAYGFTL